MFAVSLEIPIGRKSKRFGQKNSLGGPSIVGSNALTFEKVKLKYFTFENLYRFIMQVP